jgi:murein DD-endopeptidase MepM/ murein hydrolase activator NlpD
VAWATVRSRLAGAVGPFKVRLDRVPIGREHLPYVGHLAVLCMVIAAVMAGQSGPFARPVAPVPSLPLRPQTQPDLLVSQPLPANASKPADPVASAPNAGAVPPPAAAPALPASQEAVKSRALVKYKVAPGDTPGEIAERFGISTDTLLQANDITDPGGLQIGEELVILPVSGVLHTVASGDNLHDLALLYGVTPESIAEYNRLADPNSLQVGEKLIVPGGKIQAGRGGSSRGGRPTSSGMASGSFRWPVGGSITQYFGENGHTGIDLANNLGTPVYAADGGVVVTALKLGYGYGWHLVIDHGNGYQTLYGHLSAFFVDYGEKVNKGDRIGSVGSTGLSTGPHLHFEVIQNGARVNPLKFLP